MMSAEPDRRALLTDYQAALAQFDAISEALTHALLQSGGANGQAAALIAAETSARDSVVLYRMRLINACRDSDRQMAVPGIPQSPS
jgi:hypothetical protein